LRGRTSNRLPAFHEFFTPANLLVLTIVWLTNRHFEGKKAAEKAEAAAVAAPPASH
jgi:hypothetical protein